MSSQQPNSLPSVNLEYKVPKIPLVKLSSLGYILVICLLFVICKRLIHAQIDWIAEGGLVHLLGPLNNRNVQLD
jgi:hypothetical protein